MTNPEKYFRISQTQLSLARHYGGCTVNGSMYIYNPVDDSLTREDVWKKSKPKLKVKVVNRQMELPQ